MRQQVILFTAGLSEPLRTDVELQAPAHLQTAMSLAWAYERRNTMSVIDATSQGGLKTKVPTVQGPTKVTTPSRQSFRRLFAEEMARFGSCPGGSKKEERL